MKFLSVTPSCHYTVYQKLHNILVLHWKENINLYIVFTLLLKGKPILLK